MASRNLFPCFNVFNIIFGVTGLCVIILAVFLIIKNSFNSLFFLIIIIGIFMICFMCLGLLCNKRICVLRIYMALIIISLLFFGTVGVAIEFFSDKIKALIVNLFDLTNDYVTSMGIGNHIEYFIVPYSLCGVCLIVIIASIVYYKSIAEHIAKVNKEKADGDPLLRNLDYSDDMPLGNSDD